MISEPRAGDIVLYTVSGRSEFSSRVVAAGELLAGMGRGAVQFSHAAVLDHGGFQYEAKWPKTGRYPVDIARPYEIWRIEGMTQIQRHEVLMWCARHVGEWYDIVELLTFGLIQHRNRSVCSQFVDRAFRRAGVRLGREGQALLSPDAIADDPRARLIYRYTPKEA